jgi:hypothetical protein
VKRAATATAHKPATGAEGATQGDKDGYLH